MDETTALQNKLAELQSEHLQIQRLKKRKLVLKDEIIRIKNKLLPDIIA